VVLDFILFANKER